MSGPIIEVRNLTKHYRLGSVGATSIREEFSRYWDRLRGVPHRDQKDFWALKDASFDVQPGEVVGVIGRNGAGKSTLLKILSRITEPTSGTAKLRGRVASLLEVGTGFHPELTGRENVYLNGAILGMSRAEVRKKFDEIVAFAEVDQFIDTPVKRYSSGMYVRLAFAVAAHLEPEILIVDEVLAVGDAAFQKKCLGKMQDVARGQGRTVLFVSHNMAAVSQLTEYVILLQDGQVRHVGKTADALAQYSSDETEELRVSYDVSDLHRTSHGSGAVRFQRLWFQAATPMFPFASPLSFHLTATARENIEQMRLSLTIFAVDGTPVGSGFTSCELGLLRGQTRDFKVALPNLSLAPGKYYFGVALGLGDHTTGHTDFDVIGEVLRFEVVPPKAADGTIPHRPRSWGSLIISGIEAR